MNWNAPDLKKLKNKRQASQDFLLNFDNASMRQTSNQYTDTSSFKQQKTDDSGKDQNQNQIIYKQIRLQVEFKEICVGEHGLIGWYLILQSEYADESLLTPFTQTKQKRHMSPMKVVMHSQPVEPLF